MRRYGVLALALAAPVLAGALIAGVPAGNAAAGGDTSRAPAASVAPEAARLVPAVEGELGGVAALSPRYAWAVGDDANNPLILRWNGKTWRKVSAANPSPGQDDLDAVAARNTKNAWAVGARGGNALVLHWNGTAWKSVANPILKGGSLLVSVAIISATSAWAVGGTGNPSKPLIEHWNGKAWKQAVKFTAPGNLEHVAALSADNVWAVGGDNSGVLIEHWNGKAWRHVPAPSPVDSELLSVAVTSATNAWAVGEYTNGTITDFTLVEHWNGKKWTRVAGPSPRQGALLFDVAAWSPSLAFAVGSTEPDFIISQPGNTFMEKWNGHVWREVTKPTPFFGLVAAVAFGSAKSAFAVGSNLSLSYNPNGWTLIERWNGTAWG